VVRRVFVTYQKSQADPWWADGAALSSPLACNTGVGVASHWQPGLIALHGNQTEVLADTVLAWLAAPPLVVL
jgi:hypothetical protein